MGVKNSQHHNTLAPRNKYDADKEGVTFAHISRRLIKASPPLNESHFDQWELGAGLDFHPVHRGTNT